MFSNNNSNSLRPNLLEEGENGLTNGSSSDMMDISDDDGREGWDNKMQFFMGVISYAVGFGNVWRFPFLLQKNGGGAFLIPYLIVGMMVIEGVPLFLIELGIGQKLRTGPVGVWNAIHPYLGGVGVSAAIVSYLVSLYYNVILTWVFYYLFKSFSFELPWINCPKLANGSNITECVQSSTPANYFWNREAINTSDSIGDFGGFTWHMTFCLIFAWSVIYLCVMRGIKSSGKVMYLTATFPYFVLTAFMFRSILLPGATDGLRYMITPDLSRLWEPDVWLDAATQIFYSMGLGFGGLIAFASYNPVKNNCKKDVLKMSLANLLTSLYTAFVIFCVLGYMGRKNFNSCIEKDMSLILKVAPGLYKNMEEINGNITMEEFTSYMQFDFRDSKFSEIINHPSYKKCELGDIISEAAEGTGLAFVVFTEAISQFPFPPFWAILFFLMLMMLGLGSMFGTLEGVITSLNDAKMIKLSQPMLSYWVSMFDHFAGTYALMCVAFFEVVAVIYVYGCDNFVRDLQYMCDEQIGNFWKITWRFISPVIMFVIFVASIFKSFTKVPEYSAYDASTTHQHLEPYPTWALFIAFGLVVIAMAPVPFIWFVRKFKIWSVEADIPVASKCLGATASTTYMLRSEMSFNRILESANAAELRNIGKNGRNMGRNGHIGGGSAPVSSKHKHQTHDFDYHQLPYNNQHHTWHSGNAPPKHKYAQSSDTDLPSATKSVDTTNKKRKGNGNSSTGNSLSNSINKANKAFLADGFVPRSNTLSAQHSMDLEKQQQKSWTRNRHKSFEK
uniref:Transporter n=1 Tax=Meloidogyne javanica TaxID=6303 RepID=A0A915MGM1_MELJA